MIYCPQHRRVRRKENKRGDSVHMQAKLAAKRHINILIVHIAQARLEQGGELSAKELLFWNNLKKHCQTTASDMWNNWQAQKLTRAQVSLLMKSRTPLGQLHLLPLLDRTYQTYRLTLSPNCDWNIITSHIKSLPLEVISTGLKGISEV
jgi:hypothetical protein